MKLKNSLLGVLIVGIMCAGTFDCSAQNVRKKDDKGVPTFRYDSGRDRTKVTYPGGRRIIIRGKWDRDDARELEETLQELKERLSELENIEIEIPDLLDLDIDLHGLDFVLERLSDEISMSINDEILNGRLFDEIEFALDEMDVAFDELDVEMEELDIELEELNMNMEDLNLEIELFHLEDVMKQFGDEFYFFEGLNIQIPDISEILEPLKDLDIKIKSSPVIKRRIEIINGRTDWDRTSVQEKKKRKTIH